VPPIDDESVIEELLRRGECSESEARIIASCSDGDLTSALEFIYEDVQEIRNDVVSMFRSALRGREHRIGISEAAESVAEHRSKSRALTYLRFMSVWLRDTHVIAQTGSTAALTNQDMQDTLVKFAGAFGHADFGKAFSCIDRAAYDISHHVSINVTLTTLLMELRSVFSAKR
jgi:hypothetical protein